MTAGSIVPMESRLEFHYSDAGVTFTQLTVAEGGFNSLGATQNKEIPANSTMSTVDTWIMSKRKTPPKFSVDVYLDYAEYATIKALEGILGKSFKWIDHCGMKEGLATGHILSIENKTISEKLCYTISIQLESEWTITTHT